MERYEKYKDSGIDWIGEIPEHWQSKKFKYLLSFINEKSSVELPKIGLENIESQTGRFISSDTDYEGDGTYFKVSDILYGKLRPYLAKVFLADFEGKAVGDFFVFRPKSELNPKYSHKLILSKGFIDITNSSTFGSKMPRVSPEFIANLVIYYPTLEEQETIARYLDRKTAEIDQLIAQKERLIELYEEEKTAIINRAVTKGINSDVKFKPSGIDWLGDIPKHWLIVPLKRLSKIYDCKHKTVSFINYGFPVVSITQVQGFFIDLSEANQTSEEEFIDMNEGGRTPKYGDIIFSRNATVGASAMVRDDVFCMGQDVCLIRSNQTYPEFLNFSFRAFFIKFQIDQCLQGATFKRINIEEIKNLLLCFPPLEEQKAIAHYIETECDRINAKIAKTQGSRSLL